MNPIIEEISKELVKEDRDHFKVGDGVKVHVRVREGEKERIQVFEGVVIAWNAAGARSTVTVRKISYGVGVERVFPIYSPNIQKIEWMRRGRVRRAKLYYMRELRGKKARLAEVHKAKAPSVN